MGVYMIGAKGGGMQVRSTRRAFGGVKFRHCVDAQQKRIEDMELALKDEKKKQDDPAEVKERRRSIVAIGVPENGSSSSSKEIWQTQTRCTNCSNTSTQHRRR
uniref:Uncharacterized protein n=1 Tax=Caenorhabditis japonica TaxID=281687 RepID=A0A8R1I859_CAEJA